MAKKAGQPTKFSEAHMETIKYMAIKGATDKEIAHVLGVNLSTFSKWKVAHPEFYADLKTWKEEADAKVERSLYERATGYSCKETKLFCHEGMIVAEDIVKFYPPDTTAMIFWLKNRKPAEWREKTEVINTNTNMTLEEFLRQQSENK